MKYIFLFLIFLAACSDTMEEPNNDNRTVVVDYCEEFEWYGDGNCLGQKGEGPVCIGTPCPDVVGAVCEDYCGFSD